MPFLAGQTLTASQINRATKKLIAYGRRLTSSATTTTIVGVERLDDIPIEVGQAYRILVTGLFGVSTVANDRILAEIRYTTDGSTPTTASPVMTGGRFYQWVEINSGSTGEHGAVLDCKYHPAADETLSILLTVARNFGTGNVSLFADSTAALELRLYADGDAVGDTGTDV